MIHGVGGIQGSLLVDMDKSALALAGGIGDPGDAFLDQLAGAGTSALKIIGQTGKGRHIGHGFHPSLGSGPSAGPVGSLLFARSGRDVEIKQGRTQRFAMRIERQ